MKKLMVAAVAAAVFAAFADEPKPAAQDAEAQSEVEESEAEEDEAPLFWGFGATGIYSGYQLYGDLLNSEPTWQTYAEGNMNLPWDIGSIGVGIWLNSDLTDKRNKEYFEKYDAPARERIVDGFKWCFPEGSIFREILSIGPAGMDPDILRICQFVGERLPKDKAPGAAAGAGSGGSKSISDSFMGL